MVTMVSVSFSLITVALLLVGCSAGRLFSTGPVAELAPDDAIATILVQPLADSSARAREGKLITCARRELEERRWADRIVAPDEFRPLALTEPGQQPRSSDDWVELARDPSFQERIAGLNLRYLIVVDERYWKRSSRWDWTFDPRGVLLGGGLFFWATWEVSSEMHAQIVDLRNARHEGGRPSFPEPAACSKFGEGVSEALLGNISSENRERAR